MDHSPSRRPARRHLLFLDGLRGLAALYVAASHALAQITWTLPRAEISNSFLFATRWLVFGSASVDIFIVLSGFCLMLPVVQAGGELRGGLVQFAKRRSRRILPPYYAALALSLLLIGTVPSLAHPVNKLWAGAVPAFSASVILSHLLLVHNFSLEWLYKIGYPLWSIAAEWQIYFVFALLLLPVWRRCGIVATIGTAFFVGYLPHFFFHHRFDTAGFRLVILFAFGMGAATLAFSKDAAHERIAAKAFWGWLSAAAALFYGILAACRPNWLLVHMNIHEALVGTATAAMLLIAARQSQGRMPSTGPVALIVGLLECRSVVALGTFSYSLYLIHAPLLALVFSAVSLTHVPAVLSFLLCEAVGVPICVGCAYVFHLAFERPFLSKSGAKSAKEAEIAAIVSPAP